MVTISICRPTEGAGLPLDSTSKRLRQYRTCLGFSARFSRLSAMPLEEQALQRIRQRVGTTVQAAYRLERLLGIGGSAAVFEATHTHGNRVALKVLHPEFAKLPQVRTRFLREGYVANRIAHSGVARIPDDGDDDAAKTVFLVIELLEGETVETRRRRLGGRLPPAEVLEYDYRVFDLPAISHVAGFVHRDMQVRSVYIR